MGVWGLDRGPRKGGSNRKAWRGRARRFSKNGDRDEQDERLSANMRLLKADAGGNTSVPSSPAEGGHRPGQLLSGVRRTDAFPANPGWGLAQERPENWSTALSETGTTGPTPRQGSISKISAPRSAPMVHLCQQLLSVGSEITVSAHDRRPPPARPLHHP